MVNSKRKLSKSLTILLFPVLAIIFIIGFCLYCLGERERPTTKMQSDQSKSNGVTILPIVFEEHEEEIYV